MLEITIRQFRLEDNEKNGFNQIIEGTSTLETIKKMKGYIPGTLRGFNGDYRADFATKVI